MTPDQVIDTIERVLQGHYPTEDDWLEAREEAEKALAALGPQHDRLFVNDERTVLVRIWKDGTTEVATRDAPDHTWGPPVYLSEERT